MSKLDYLQQKKLNPADELRELLNILESDQPRIKSLNSAQALDLLRNLDQANALFTQLAATDLNLLPEQGRFEALQIQVKRNVAALLIALGGPETLSKHRPDPAPPREQWWWYIHEIVADQRRRLLKRLVIGFVSVLAVLGIIVVAFNTVLAPSPEAIARVEAENKAFAAFENGDYEIALAAVKQGLAVVPDDSDLLTLKGIFQELLIKEGEAAASFNQAKAKHDDPATFYLYRGQLYLGVNQPVKAENDARTALGFNENLSAGWFLLGRSLELQDIKPEAISVYQQASDIALANGDNEIVVLARMALSRATMGP